MRRGFCTQILLRDRPFDREIRIAGGLARELTALFWRRAHLAAINSRADRDRFPLVSTPTLRTASR
jgi:hypothetical protein